MLRKNYCGMRARQTESRPSYAGGRLQHFARARMRQNQKAFMDESQVMQLPMTVSREYRLASCARRAESPATMRGFSMGSLSSAQSRGAGKKRAFSRVILTPGVYQK
jgi:hypothetical protein